MPVVRTLAKLLTTEKLALHIHPEDAKLLHFKGTGPRSRNPGFGVPRGSVTYLLCDLASSFTSSTRFNHLAEVLEEPHEITDLEALCKAESTAKV